MKAADVRTKSVDELKEELLKLRKEQLNLRFQRSTGQLENSAAMRSVRKNIARVKTVLTEQEKGIKVAAPKAKPAKKSASKTKTEKTASKAKTEKSAPKKKKSA